MALRLKEDLPNHRVVYCLPFTSIIDQNGKVLKDILRKTGISENIVTLHHYLSAPQKKTASEDEMSYQESEYLTEGWENEIIVTTFVQLFESIFTNSNRALRKFHNLANSIIILDEVQNVPPKFIEIIEAVFEEMASSFNTKFFFVTATQPLILKDKVIRLAEPANKSQSYFFDGLDRIVLDQSLFIKVELTLEELLGEIRETVMANPTKSILVIVNTKAFSQEIFNGLKNSIPLKCLYLSAGLIPIHRKQVIDEVREAAQSICLVSTQVVEAGVDIDFDVVYREFAPMDSINQAAGRCNRNGIKGKGLVKIFKKEGKNWIYDDVLLDITKEVLSERDPLISESEILQINRDYFVEVQKRIQEDSNESNDLLGYIHSLQFEKIKENFKLIKKDYREYNFFIPINKEAQSVWEKYEKLREIKNPFERKAKMKEIKPSLLNYVVSVPDYAVELDEEEKEQHIIHRDHWEEMYDPIIGVKLRAKDKSLGVESRFRTY